MSEREQFEAYLRDIKFPVLPVWRDGSPYQNYALEVMWKSWQASRRAALEEAKAIADMARAGYSAAGLTQHAAGAWCVHEEIRALAASDSEGGKSE